MTILDSLLQDLGLLAVGAKDFLLLVMNWFLPIDMSPYQVMLSVFKIGTILVIAYVAYDNTHSLRK